MSFFDLHKHLPNIDPDSMLVSELMTLVMAACELPDDQLALHVADDMGYPVEDFPALIRTARLGDIGEDHLVIMQGPHRLVHVRLSTSYVVKIRPRD